MKSWKSIILSFPFFAGPPDQPPDDHREKSPYQPGWHSISNYGRNPPGYQPAEAKDPKPINNHSSQTNTSPIYLPNLREQHPTPMGFNIYNVRFGVLLHFFAKYYANKPKPRTSTSKGHNMQGIRLMTSIPIGSQ